MASNGKLPKGWTESRIDEVADVSISSVDKKSVEGQRSVRLCNYMDVWKNPYIHHGLDFMEATASEIEIDRFSLAPGDVLLTKDSETKEEIAEPSVVWEKIDNLILGYHLALVRPHAAVTDGPFLAAQLRIPEFRSQFIRAASGATRYGLSMDTVCGAKVWLPPYELQTKISGIIRSIDEAIEATRAVIEPTRRLKTALLQDLLTNGLPGQHKKFNTSKRGLSFPESWEHLPLGQVAEFQNGKAFPSSDYDQGTVPLLRPGNLHISGRVMWDAGHTTTVPDSYLDSASDYIVRSNELVMNLTAQSLEDDFLGRVCWTHNTEECCLLNQRLARFRAINCNLRFLYWTFKGPAFRDHVSRLPSGSKVQHLYNADLESFYVPLPDPGEQQKIAQVLDSAEEREQQEHSYLERLFATKSALSQGLLTGRIPVKGGK